MPPFTGLAVKVTFVPAQIVADVVEILTLAARLGFTVMVIVLEEAGLPVEQEASEVNTQLITSPDASAEDE